MHMPHDLLDPNPTNTIDFIMMTSRSYSTKNTWYIEYEVTGPPEQKEKYVGEVIQLPAVRGTAKSTNHKSNVIDLIKQMYPKTTTLADIGITKAREAKILLLSDLRNLCGKGLTVENMLKTSMCQLTWMTALLHVNQRTL